MKAKVEAICEITIQRLLLRARTAPTIVKAVKKAKSACSEANCETTKQTVILAQIEAANQDLREESPGEECAAKAEAKIIPKPESADQKRTANSPQPKNFSAKASSHQAPSELPAVKASPILGVK